MKIRFIKNCTVNGKKWSKGQEWHFTNELANSLINKGKAEGVNVTKFTESEQEE